MPTMSYDPNSGALLFTPTKDDLERIATKKKITELEEKINQLTTLLESLISKEER